MTTNEPSWPIGLSDEIAVIDISIEELEALYGTSFARDLDDLDYFRYLVFRVASKSYALRRYENAPMPGVTLVVEEGGELAVANRLAEALDALQLTDRGILWRRE